MAKSRHSVVCLQMSQREQQWGPKHPHGSQRRLTSTRGCRLLDSQPHAEAHREQIQLLHPRTVASKQSRGRQKRQASRIAAQSSRKENVKLPFSVKRERRDCARQLNVPTFAVRLGVGGGRLEALGLSADRRERRALFPGGADLGGRWQRGTWPRGRTTDRRCPRRTTALVHFSRNSCSYHKYIDLF